MQVYHYKESGPCFGDGCDIGINGNPLKEKTLYTHVFIIKEINSLYLNTNLLIN